MLSLATLLLCCGACGYTREAGVTRQTAGQALPPFQTVTIEHAGCYGTCPVYRLTIYGDGFVVYEGFAHVGVVGLKTAQLSLEQVRQIDAAFAQADYFALRDVYRSEADGCPSTATDLETVFTSVKSGDRFKRIEHFHGCLVAGARLGSSLASFPAELSQLEEQIDQIANSAQWIEGLP